MENLTGEIEKLIAKYQQRQDELMNGPISSPHTDRQKEGRAAAGELFRVIDDLKRLAGIA